MSTRKSRQAAQAEAAYGSLFDGFDQSLMSEFGSDVTTARSVHRAVGGRTGVLSIDVALGGGLPSGITEVTGEESVGKTALIGRIISEAQSFDVPVALVRGDYLDKPYLANLGVDLNELIIFPGSDDDLVGLVVGFLSSAPKVLLTVDSLNGIRPSQEEPGAWNEHMLFLLDKIRLGLSVDSAAVVTTQVRTRKSAEPDKMFARGTASSAERMADLFDTKIVLSRTEVEDYLYKMCVDIKKSALGAPARYLEVPATKGHGIEVELDFINVAKTQKVVELRGPRMYFGDRFIGMGARGAAQTLMRDDHLMNEMFRSMLPDE